MCRGKHNCQQFCVNEEGQTGQIHSQLKEKSLRTRTYMKSSYLCHLYMSPLLTNFNVNGEAPLASKLFLLQQNQQINLSVFKHQNHISEISGNEDCSQSRVMLVGTVANSESIVSNKLEFHTSSGAFCCSVWVWFFFLIL